MEKGSCARLVFNKVLCKSGHLDFVKEDGRVLWDRAKNHMPGQVNACDYVVRREYMGADVLVVRGSLQYKVKYNA